MNQPTAADILKELQDPRAPVLNLLARCRAEPYEEVWKEGPELYRRFARLLLKKGHPTLALEVAARGLDKKFHPNDHDLLYSRARALVNSGNTTRAEQFVQELIALPDLSPQARGDVLALAGRIRKDRASRLTDPDRQRTLFREARDYYQRAYKVMDDPFPGINAASLSLLAGEPDRARELAAEIRDIVLAQLDQPGKDRDYWALATLGEAYLLLGDMVAAKGRYSQAVRLAREGEEDGDIASMHRQLLLLRKPIPIREDLLGLFHAGPVVVFAGHGLDRAGEPPRFPADANLEEAVRRAIKHELDALETNIGYCMPGCGSDILFGELLRERDAELHVVLPFDEEDFCSERVTYDLPELAKWRDRYEALRGHVRVTRHFATTEEFLGDQVLYDFAGTFMQGLALTRAEQVGVEPIALIVQDSTPSQQLSGLSAFVENWRKSKRPLRIIDLADIRKRTPWTQPSLRGGKTSVQRTPQREVKAMLFADVAGFSGLRESHLPEFFMEFLRLVEKQLKETPALFQNTWGDGLYIVFNEVIPCAKFALGLLRQLESFDFSKFKFDLKEDKKPGVRIGLHTGPVFKGWDAIIERENYYGSHVSRAARIEPVTAPGCAFVSEQFAAALALVGGHDLVCEYLGLQPLAKEYDTCPLYRLTCRE